MKKLIFIVFSMFLMSTMYAVLPPFYHTVKEIETILSDERLAKELGSAEGITKIEKTENGYVITTYKYRLEVDVVYIPQHLIGPSKFELKFHEKIPFESKNIDDHINEFDQINSSL